MSPSTLIAYKHEVKMSKQRNMSNNENQLQQLINTATMNNHDEINRLATANQSHLHSKRSETSHEVWNAQSMSN